MSVDMAATNVRLPSDLMDHVRSYASEHRISLNAALTVYITWGRRVRELSASSVAEAVYFTACAAAERQSVS